MKYKLHEEQEVDAYLRRYAVPGGWLYGAIDKTYMRGATYKSLTFVPDLNVEIEVKDEQAT